MGWLFKLFGSLMVIAASCAAGYMKSYELRQRGRRLTELCRGLSSLKERMRMGCGELKGLLPKALKTGLLRRTAALRLTADGLIKRMSPLFTNI